MLRPLRLFPPVIALMAIWTNRAAATDPDTFSAVVSFQYQESLADSETTITSPVVSYQYYEWPGDENLTFENSPAVSFYFPSGPTLQVSGNVTRSSGAPVAGALVTLKRYSTDYRQATTNASGSYSIAALPADNYTVVISKPGYLTRPGNITGTAGGSMTRNFQIDPLPTALVVTDVNRELASTAVRVVSPTALSNPDAPRLKVFDGSKFVDCDWSKPETVALLDPGRPTVAMSHGWNSGTGDWITLLAFQIKTRLGANAVNLVAWDWSTQAATTAPPIDAACQQGELFGKALMNSPLGSGYAQHLHFIGHSLGTIVNAYACDYVHGRFSWPSMRPPIPWSSASTRPQITLLDEAEIASIFGANVTTAAAIGWKAAQLKGALILGTAAAVANWRDPIPKSAYWTDNYISAVGLQRDGAVNVCLTAPSVGFLSLIDAHSYAYSWYSNTVSPTGTPAPVGFGSSMESGHVFPPAGVGETPGNLWYENLSTPYNLDLNYQPNPIPFEANIGILAAYSIQGAATLGSNNPVSNAVLSGYDLGIKFAGNVGGTVIYKTGNVISSAAEKVGLWWDAASDKAADVLNSINPDNANADNLSAAVLRLQLSTFTNQTTAKQTSGIHNHRTLDVNAADSQQPLAWMNVEVPADAGMMAFDFKVTGDPQEDKIACAINDQNVFTLPAKYAPDGETVSTDLIDVSAYAGQTVELFFGLTGGTSTDCELVIDGVRFITIPQPKLVANVVGDQVRLSWPAAATGWVLESSDSLELGSWQEIPTTNSVTVDQGVASMDLPKTGPKKFYRLRRVE